MENTLTSSAVVIYSSCGSCQTWLGKQSCFLQTTSQYHQISQAYNCNLYTSINGLLINPRRLINITTFILTHSQAWSLQSPLTSSQLESRQIRQNLSTRNIESPPHSRHIQRTGKCIGVSKEQHRWDPSSCILKSETSIFHLVLLDGTTMKMVNTSLRIDFWLVASWGVGELSSHENVEIVISGVTTSVTFCSNGGSFGYVSGSLVGVRTQGTNRRQSDIQWYL